MRNRSMFLFVILFTAAAAGCGTSGVDNPGNPSTNVQEARSSLERDLHPDVDKADSHTLASGNADFAFDLYARLVQEKPEASLFVSPYSISSALAMTYAGARGDTANQISEVMHFDLPQERLHPAFNALDLTLESRGSEIVKEGHPFELDISNALWGQEGFPFKQDFLDLLAKNYGAGLMLVDFAGAAESARQQINAWVEDHTNGRIKDLLGPGVITSLTRLVLTNTIYFKAGWKDEFDKKLTQDHVFHTLAGKDVTVKMMNMKMDVTLPYTDTDDYQAVVLPYVGDNVAMVLIVPAKGKFLDVESDMDGEWFLKLLGQLNISKRPGIVSMPKFGMEYKASLADTLQDMGMKLPFNSNKADFSGISRKFLYISDVIHQTFLKVDEEGSEAAGATAVVMNVTSAGPEPPPQPFRMVVDRPFIFAIVDRPTNAVLFLGRMLNPTK